MLYAIAKGDYYFLKLGFGFFPLLLGELFVFKSISEVGYREVLFIKEGSVEGLYVGFGDWIVYMGVKGGGCYCFYVDTIGG